MNGALAGIFSGIGFSDVVDILIVSYVLYKLLGYIHSSRAAQLGKGLGILIAAFFISDFFHLYSIRWILSNVLSVGLLALVIIFQPELRRALEYLGRGKFSGRQSSFSRERATDMSDMIVRAVEYFAAKKEGSIIVIERETALSDIAETGTIIDAELSEELLENIFYKGSPLHDGAVIIRDERILAAGCVLPLTENAGLSKDLGTRHRAGIGISEVSDAIVLIVSEETGIISMATDGKLSRFLDLKTVEKTLLGYYLGKIEHPNIGTAIINGIFRRKDDD